MENDHTHPPDSRVEALEQALETTKYLLLANMESAFFQHEVRNGLIFLFRRLELLKADLADGRPPGAIDRGFEGMQKIIHSLLSLDLPSPLDPKDLKITDINAFIFEFVEHQKSIFAFDDVRVQSELEPGPLLARISQSWLTMCMNILINNAQRAMEKSANKTLKFTTQTHGGNVEIHVSDNGKGVASGIRELLFLKPIRHETDQQHGTGLLLANVVIQNFGGNIRLVTSDKGGSVFAISLPQV